MRYVRAWCASYEAGVLSFCPIPVLPVSLTYTTLPSYATRCLAVEEMHVIFR